MSEVLPISHKDELGILGCCLVGGLDTAIEAVEAVPAEAFSHDGYREIFDIIETLATHGEAVNPYTVGRKWSELTRKPIPLETLNEAEQATPSAENLRYHTETVIENYRKRRIMTAGHELWIKGQNNMVKADSLLADAEAILYNEDIKSVSVLDAKGAIQRMTNDLERRFLLKGKLSGISTGFDWFDRLTDGLQFKEQTIIGARPSMGKTALGLNITQHACLKLKVPTLFVSLEMSPEALLRRMLSATGVMGMGDIKRGSYTDEQFRKFATFQGLVNGSPLWIVDGVGGMTIAQVCASVRRYVRKHKIQLVIVDYLQKIRPTEKHEKRTYEVGEVSGQLKALAVTTGSAFVTLAQLNRESEKDKGRPPKLSDLADSGQIERDADTVGLIHRDKSDRDGGAQLIIAKQRDGELGMVNLKFNGYYCRFENPQSE